MSEKKKGKDDIEEDQEIDKVKLLKELKDKNIIIHARDLVKDYEIGDFIVRAVDGVSINVKEGQFIAIRGPSGAGKTTLLNLLGGLDTPNAGIIYSHGVKISDMKEESLSTFRLLNSGFIFQNYNLISTLTAEENVMFPMNIAGMTFREQRARAVELLKRVGLLERREHLPFQLSAGEQQRVAISRALANDPPIIFGDEITANLDKRTSEFIRDIFRDLKSEKKTIVIATHDNKLLDLADKIIDFDDGKIVEENNLNKI